MNQTETGLGLLQSHECSVRNVVAKSSRVLLVLLVYFYSTDEVLVYHSGICFPVGVQMLEGRGEKVMIPNL